MASRRRSPVVARWPLHVWPGITRPGRRPSYLDLALRWEVREARTRVDIFPHRGRGSKVVRQRHLAPPLLDGHVNIGQRRAAHGQRSPACPSRAVLSRCVGLGGRGTCRGSGPLVLAQARAAIAAGDQAGALAPLHVPLTRGAWSEGRAGRVDRLCGRKGVLKAAACAWVAVQRKFEHACMAMRSSRLCRRTA
jgi:hypothetical protein